MKIVSIFMLVICFSACQDTLIHDLGEKDAATALFNLHHAGISAEKSRSASGWSLHVDKDQIPQATAVLTRVGLLRTKEPSLINQRKRFLLSRSERAHLLELSIASRIEETLETLPGVLDARVNLFLHLSDDMRLQSSNRQASASAVLIVAGGFAVGKNSISRIIQGAASIPGERIEVILVNDERFTDKPSISDKTTIGEPSLWFKAQSHSIDLSTNYSISILASLGAGLSLWLVCLSRRRARSQFVSRMKNMTDETDDRDLGNDRVSGLFQDFELKQEESR